MLYALLQQWILVEFYICYALSELITCNTSAGGGVGQGEDYQLIIVNSGVA